MNANVMTVPWSLTNTPRNTVTQLRQTLKASTRMTAAGGSSDLTRAT